MNRLLLFGSKYPIAIITTNNEFFNKQKFKNKRMIDCVEKAHSYRFREYIIDAKNIPNNLTEIVREVIFHIY